MTRLKRLIATLIIVPIGVVVVLFGLANRGPVTVSLDPFSTAAPAMVVTMPLFVLVLLAVAIGVVVGGVADWLRQGRFRREARRGRTEIAELRRETEALKVERQPSHFLALIDRKP